MQAAQAAYDEAVRAADASKANLLEEVAQTLPDAVDAVAKSRAHAEPDVTRRLHDTGEIESLRGDLRRIAAELGDRVRTSSGKIDWPENSNGTFVAARVREVVRNVFTSEAVRPIERRLNDAGFDDFLLYPNLLMNDQAYSSAITAVAGDLVRLNAATTALAEASKSNDQDFVNDVWK